MGDWYDFQVREIDGKEVFGFSYQSEATGWDDKFVVMSPHQAQLASEIMTDIQRLENRKDLLIKSFLGI